MKTINDIKCSYKTTYADNTEREIKYKGVEAIKEYLKVIVFKETCMNVFYSFRKKVISNNDGTYDFKLTIKFESGTEKRIENYDFKNIPNSEYILINMVWDGK